MKKRIISTALLLLIAVVSFSQDVTNEYDILTVKADSLLNVCRYEEAAFAYTKAININGGKGKPNDRYNAACAFAMANYPDSAFNHLNMLTTKAAYSYYSRMATDEDLFSLHADKRWKLLLEKVKQNKMKADEKWALSCGGSDVESIDASTIAQINNYQLNVDINVKSKTVSVNGYVDVDFHGQDSINLVLFGKSEINAIKNLDQSLKYTFDTVAKSPIIYIPDGRRLTVFKAVNSPQKQKIHFSYTCNMDNVSGWGRSFNENWIEIGFYTAWYPVNAESKNALSELNITIDELYNVSGSGVVVRNGNKWKMLHQWPIYDNVIIASKDLKSKTVEIDDTSIETMYTSFPKSDIDSVALAFKDILNYYEQIFGKQSSSYMKFVLCPTKGGGGYSRKNYISLKVNKYGLGLKRGIAHEMAHFWWNKANSNTWEDWLNEAFAEYSMLLYIKKELGQSVFDSYIDAYRVNISKSCPIWGIDRAKPEAYSALYEKGALILCDLHSKIGDDKFFSFLRTVVNNNIKTTKGFLLLTEKELGTDTRNWFEMKLKAENDD